VKSQQHPPPPRPIYTPKKVREKREYKNFLALVTTIEKKNFFSSSTWSPDYFCRIFFLSPLQSFAQQKQHYKSFSQPKLCFAVAKKYYPKKSSNSFFKGNNRCRLFKGLNESYLSLV